MGRGLHGARRPSTPEEKREIGRQANELKRTVETAVAEREGALAANRRRPGSVDVTLPGRRVVLGSRHPLNLVREQVQEIFTHLGYQVLEGPEIEDDYHNFEALNMPVDHPARDMQDTLYLAETIPPSPRDFDRASSVRQTREPRTPQPSHCCVHTLRRSRIRPWSSMSTVRLVAMAGYRRDNLDLARTHVHRVEGLPSANMALADTRAR